uniref:Uncharacterized protein n=1 Tax=Cacopsylla melanoneura TaxID=428564 RepID=A0A8D8ZF25_9HEMI
MSLWKALIRHIFSSSVFMIKSLSCWNFSSAKRNILLSLAISLSCVSSSSRRLASSSFVFVIRSLLLFSSFCIVSTFIFNSSVSLLSSMSLWSSFTSSLTLSFSLLICLFLCSISPMSALRFSSCLFFLSCKILTSS